MTYIICEAFTSHFVTKKKKIPLDHQSIYEGLIEIECLYIKKKD
jgi:hypothetical protein